MLRKQGNFKTTPIMLNFPLEPDKALRRLNLKRATWLLIPLLVQAFLAFLISPPTHAWFDETHIAVAKAACCKFFNVNGIS